MSMFTHNVCKSWMATRASYTNSEQTEEQLRRDFAEFVWSCDHTFEEFSEWLGPDNRFLKMTKEILQDKLMKIWTED